MKLNRETLRKLILMELRQVMLEERDLTAAKEFLEKRKAPDLSDEAKKNLRKDYKIASIKDVEIGDRNIKRFFFMTDPVDVDVTPKKEETE